MVLTAIVNLALDFAFIPRYGAIGAAIGNGVAQAFGVFLFWKAATNIYPLHIPTRAILRIATSSAVAALAAFGVARNFRPVLGLTAGIMVAVPVFVFMLRILRALESSDYVRLNLITKRLPVAVRWLAERALQFAVPQYIAGEAIPEAEAPARRAG
jgi:O-antigen/teichoic acid export membrane protein